MRLLQRRPPSVEELVSIGILGGLVLLAFCLVPPHPMEAEPTQSPSSSVITSSGAAGSAEMDLLFPVPAVAASTVADSFGDNRGGRRHEAIDILAPRHSGVVAVADGAIARIMTSVAGGLSVYQWSLDRHHIYYYAHLQSYAPDLTEGQPVKRGQLLGYVGTSGNAPPNTPHLHFAITRSAKKDQWWGGTAINPYPLWHRPT